MVVSTNQYSFQCVLDYYYCIIVFNGNLKYFAMKFFRHRVMTAIFHFRNFLVPSIPVCKMCLKQREKSSLQTFNFQYYFSENNASS